MNWRSLKHFARDMLKGDRLHLRPMPELIEADEIATRMILFREGQWQVELVVGRPYAVLMPHCHDQVESLHLVIGDSGGYADVAGHKFQWQGHRGPLAANLIHVPKGSAHSGVGGSHGSAFIAFQKWDTEPGFVRHDWRDA